MPNASGAPDAPSHGARASTLLVEAVRGESERVSVAEIVNALDARAFGLATLLFALPSVVPMPPGVPTIVGFALLIVSVQMVLGRRELWLPRLISKRTFPRTAMVSAFQRLQPRLEAVERIARPRLLLVTGVAGTVLIGGMILVMAIILILPLPPGGNFPPALACAVLGMGLAERDGVIVLAGMVTSVAAIAAVWAVTVGFIKYLPVVAEWIGGLFGG